jgi:8-oxo-dGTP diphosphatase
MSISAAAAPRSAQVHPWVAVDVVIFTVGEQSLEALLVKIKHGPLAGRWAFPGGLVTIGESLEGAARRELAEKTPIRQVYLEQLFTFGAPERNPAVHVVSTAYFALLPGPPRPLDSGSKYAEAAWFDVDSLPALAYDHNAIAETARERLRAKLGYTNVAWSLLPRDFTLGELQRIYEIIQGRKFDRRNFRKKILESGLLRPAGKLRLGAHRPAALYRFRNRGLRRVELF